MTSTKQLKKNGENFYPKIASESIILPDGQTLEDRLAEKQNTLISRNNIKTINNQSLLGSGTITVDSGEATILELQNLVDGEYTPVQFSREFGCTDGNFLQVVSKGYGYVKIVPTGLFTTAPPIYPIIVKKSKNSDISTGMFNGISIIEENKIIEIVRNYIRGTVKYTISTTNKDLSTKQDTLVSGTNIKTINNTSLLGEGNINVSGNEYYLIPITSDQNEGWVVDQSVTYSSICDAITNNKSIFIQDDNIIIPASWNASFVSDGTGGVIFTSYDILGSIISINILFSLNEDAVVMRNVVNLSSFISSDSLKTINNNSLIGEGDITINTEPSCLREVTYQELVDLRDNESLIPGMQYRIVDYVTVVKNDESYKSAEHPFDIIVTADTNDTLNENARACLNAGDSYFSEANVDLSKWELKYSLDNNTNRFNWSTNVGRYIIPDNQLEELQYDPLYVQELGNYFNEYDYSGTMTWNEETVYVWDSANDDGYQILTTAADYSNNNLVTNNLDFSQTPKVLATLVDGEEYEGVREDFIVYQNNDTIWVDDFPRSTPKGVIYYMKDEHGNEAPYDFKNIMFKIKTTNGYGFEYNPNGVDTWVYTFNYTENDHTITDGTINGNAIYKYNKIGTYDYKLYRNIFLTDSDESECIANTLGINCKSNIFSVGNGEFNYNVLGNECWENVFMGSGMYNKLDMYCRANYFGGNNVGNLLNMGASNNHFGESCLNNQIGTNSTYNAWGNYCEDITIGNNCHHIIFGVISGNQTLYGSGIRNVIVDDCCWNVLFDATATDPNNDSYCTKIKITGINGSMPTNPKVIQNNEFDQLTWTIYTSSSNTTINV